MQKFNCFFYKAIDNILCYLYPHKIRILVKYYNWTHSLKPWRSWRLGGSINLSISVSVLIINNSKLNFFQIQLDII